MSTHYFLRQTDMEHGQATSGILFNIRWNYDWHTDTSFDQDYKRSSFQNTGHGSVETSTFMPIASRSFIVVYQFTTKAIFKISQHILNIFSTRPREKKEKRVLTIIGSGSPSCRRSPGRSSATPSFFSSTSAQGPK